MICSQSVNIQNSNQRRDSVLGTHEDGARNLTKQSSEKKTPNLGVESEN